MGYVKLLLDKKAKENNTICLNAYAIGIEESKAPQMLEMLKRSVRNLSCGSIQQKNFIREVEQLIKQATELK